MISSVPRPFSTNLLVLSNPIASHRTRVIPLRDDFVTLPGGGAVERTSPNNRIAVMALEIERKFLVASHSWKDSVVRAVRIRDGLIANNNGHKARVRIASGVATIALKSRRHGLTRHEFEYVIPYSDAEEMLCTMCDGNVLDKVRHFVSHAGDTWHVDVYEGFLDGVVLAEIELSDEDQNFTLPDWIGTEVTADPNYRKVNMFAARRAKLKSQDSATL
jgi:CYTH domain-containing protein